MKLFDSFLQKYQTNLERSMGGSNFTFLLGIMIGAILTFLSDILIPSGD